MKTLTIAFGESIKVTNIVHEIAELMMRAGLTIQLTKNGQITAAYSSAEKTVALNLKNIKASDVKLSEALTHEMIHFFQDCVVPFDSNYIKRPPVLQEWLPTVTEGAGFMKEVMDRYDCEDWVHEEQAFQYQNKPAKVLAALKACISEG